MCMPVLPSEADIRVMDVKFHVRWFAAPPGRNTPSKVP
jgi:hypothetical protein